MSKKKRIRHHGSSIDAFLAEEGVFEAFQATAIKEVTAWQVQKVTKDGAPDAHQPRATRSASRPGARQHRD
jgi:hypothetical protein